MERLFVILDGPLPGLDPKKVIDEVEFAWHHSNHDAEFLGVTPLDAFTFAPLEEPQWNDASEGLKTVRALRTLYAEWLAKGTNPYKYNQEVQDALAKKVALFEKVEEVLMEADSRGRNFYLAARDLD